MTKIYYGIDPGEYNGVASYDSFGGLHVCTLKFWDLIDHIQNITQECKGKNLIPVFVVEDPNMNEFMYRQRVDGKGKRPSMKIAQNVGMNKNDAKRIIEFIEREGWTVEKVRPSPQSHKWNQELFNKLLKREMRCSQHARDAAKLISQYWLK